MNQPPNLRLVGSPNTPPQVPVSEAPQRRVVRWMLTVWIANHTSLYQLLISEAVVDTLDHATTHFTANRDAVHTSLEPGQWLWADATPGYRMSDTSPRWHPTGAPVWSIFTEDGHPTPWIEGNPPQ